MSEVWRIVLTASITIVGGVIVYVLGRLFVALFVEPIHRLRSLVGEIADSLVFYAPVYGNPGVIKKEVADEAGETLRRQASQLRARVYSIPWYSLWVVMGLVRERTKILEASAELVGLSNSCHGGPGVSVAQNIKMERRVEQLLGIRGSEIQSESQPINKYALSQGILLFFFALILLGVKQSTLTLFGFEIFTLPIWAYTILGIIALAMSILFMIAIFRRQLAVKLESFLEARPSPWYMYGYWVIFWLVYIAGWLKGLSSIPAEEFGFKIIYWIGVVWFFIIPIAWFKVIFQRRKKRKKIAF